MGHLHLDEQFKSACHNILGNGSLTAGRTATARLRVLGEATFKYDCTDNKFNLFGLRANNPMLAIAETQAFLQGATRVSDLVIVHPALKLWEAWSADTGSLGGVYGEAFKAQYTPLVDRLIDDPYSTHLRMTTLLPDKFPIRGNTYNENVVEGRFSLMPCLHSFHFLYDGEKLDMIATQGSGDMPIGVFPHNAYQCQYLLILTATLSGYPAGTVTHHVNDAHIYENQIPAVEEMMRREPKELHTTLDWKLAETVSSTALTPIENIVTLVDGQRDKMHPPIKILVDS